MFDIYEALRSGKNADELVAAFTKELNDAEARVKEEEKRAAEAAQARIDERNSYFTDCVENLLRGFAEYYPELGIEEEEISQDTCKAIAELIMLSLEMELPKKPRSVLPVKMELKTPAEKDAFAKFFEQFGL